MLPEEAVEAETPAPVEAELTNQVPVADLVEAAPVLEPTFAATAPEISDDSSTIPADAPTTAAQPSPTRKRGTGPTPKKSKVITKSGLLKRGQRNPLYRPSPAESALAADSLPPTAPIVSPPIIPEILLERPAAALDVVLQPEANTPPALPAEEAPATSSKTKRGRPKAKAAQAEAPTSIPVPAEEPAPAAAPGAAADAPEAAPKKAAARAPRSAKPKAPKDPAKAAAPRRGRPPGKKTPPADDAPAT
jgi:hypothetical protein